MTLEMLEIASVFDGAVEEVKESMTLVSLELVVGVAVVSEVSDVIESVEVGSVEGEPVGSCEMLVSRVVGVGMMVGKVVEGVSESADVGIVGSVVVSVGVVAVVGLGPVVVPAAVQVSKSSHAMISLPTHLVPAATAPKGIIPPWSQRKKVSPFGPQIIGPSGAQSPALLARMRPWLVSQYVPAATEPKKKY